MSWFQTKQRACSSHSNARSVRSTDIAVELAEEIQVLERTLQQRDERIERLEILVNALLEANPVDNKIPNHVRKMIEKDAPSALEHDHQGDLFEQLNMFPMQDFAVELPLQAPRTSFEGFSDHDEYTSLPPGEHIDIPLCIHSTSESSTSRWAFEDLFDFGVPGADRSL